MNTSTEIKKKIMFSKGDDFYFLSYNILLILYGLGCFCGKKTFKDYRKLAFLIDFIASKSLAQTASKGNIIYSPIDRDLFTRAYANGLLRISQIMRLLFTLEKKGLILLEREQGKDTINVCLNKDTTIDSFLDKELFKLELSNLSLLNSSIKRMTVLTLDSLLTRLFDNHGIKTWAEY